MSKLNLSQLQVGQFLSRTSYMKVIEVYFANGSVKVENEDGMQWNIGNEIVARECFTANQFTEERTVTRTELIRIFGTVGDAVYTVNYNKQPKVEDAFDAVANNGKLKSNAEMKKLLKEKMKGEERTLIGYTIKLEPEWGRSMVVDLECTDKNAKGGRDNIRQVDHRTLNWLIFKNVRYVVKG